MSTDIVVNKQMSTQSIAFINLLLGPKTSSLSSNKQDDRVDYSRSLKNQAHIRII